MSTAAAEIVFAINAEGKSLESVTKPRTATDASAVEAPAVTATA